MGSASNMDRCSRFAEEFGDDYIDKAMLKVEQNLTVFDIQLDEDFDGEGVAISYTLVDDEGNKYDLKGETGLFDAELSTKSGVIEKLVEDLGITAEEAEARLKKADLFD